MRPKKTSESLQAKRTTVKTKELKKEITLKHENFVYVLDLAFRFGLAKKPICTTLKNKEVIKEAIFPWTVTFYEESPIKRSQNATPRKPFNDLY